MTGGGQNASHGVRLLAAIRGTEIPGLQQDDHLLATASCQRPLPPSKRKGRAKDLLCGSLLSGELPEGGKYPIQPVVGQN